MDRDEPNTSRKIGAFIAIALLIAATLWFFSGTEKPESPSVTTVSGQEPPPHAATVDSDIPAPEIDTNEVVEDVPIEPVVDAPLETREESVSLTIRVFDRDTGEAVAGVPVHAMRFKVNVEGNQIQLQSGGRLIPINDGNGEEVLANDPPVGVTNSKGVVVVENAEPGQYIIVTDRHGFYGPSDAQQVSLQGSPLKQTHDIRVSKAGGLTGRALLNGEPLSNKTLTITAYPGGQRWNVELDSTGHFTQHDVPNLSGTVRGRVYLTPSDMRVSAVENVVVAPGESSTVDFHFTTGTSSIDGHVYRVSDGSPLRCRVTVIWQFEDGEIGNSENVETRTDEDGYFSFEKLTYGTALISAFPQDIPGTRKYRRRIEFKEGVHEKIEFPVYDTSIQAEIMSVPEWGRTVSLLAFPGDYKSPPRLNSEADLMRSEENLISVAPVNGGKATLTGLPPGRYTMTVSAMPSGPWPQEYFKVFADIRRVTTKIELTEQNPHINLRFDFADVLDD
jgi:hypothetical protein